MKRFEEKGLSHFSYVVGCEKSGQVAVIDPRFDVEVYLRFAEENSLVISHVMETHIHGDFASGARYLAARTDATLLLSGYVAGQEYEVQFPFKDVYEGDLVRLGSVTLEVLHTPGHSEEHLLFIAREEGSPPLLFCGDLLFVSSFGLPYTPREKIHSLAPKLFTSVKKVTAMLPTNTVIFSAHGSSGYGDRPIEVNLGQEMQSHPYISLCQTPKELEELLLRKKGHCPEYFKRMKEYNTSKKRRAVCAPASLDEKELLSWIQKGCTLIDTRDQHAFCQAHLPKSICIQQGATLGFWASQFAPYETPIVLVLSDPFLAQEMVLSLARVGHFDVVGYFLWDEYAQVDKKSLGSVSSKALQVDVRTYVEVARQPLEGVVHIPCSELPLRLEELPDEELMFICTGGVRSVLAASYAKKMGRLEVSHLSGGTLGLISKYFPNLT